MKFSIDKIFNVKTLVRELSTGLRRLDFINNFDSFETTVTLTANTETKLRNELNSIPTGMMIKKQTGNALVTAGDTDWDSNFIYLKNHSGSQEATVTVIFFK